VSLRNPEREAPEGARPLMPLEKMRVTAYLNIPSDASAREARGWLSTVPGLTTDDRIAICRVHCEDNILATWRREAVCP